MYLINFDNGDTIDSASVRGGNFESVGEVKHPFLARVAIERTRTMCCVDTGLITIEFKEEKAKEKWVNDALNVVLCETWKIT